MAHYLAFGTVYRNPLAGEKNRIDPPFECYRYPGKSSPVEVAQLNGSRVEYIPLEPSSDQYKKVMKWVHRRDILNRYRARCMVSEENLIRILNDQQEQLNQR